MIDQSKIIEGIAKMAESAIKEESGDYRIDGKLFCGKCGTPKEKDIEVMGRKFRVRCLCDCGAVARMMEERREQEIKRQREIERMRSVGFFGTDMQGWRFENDDLKNPKLTDVAKRYVENFRTMYKNNKGLLFYGSVGTGKTFMAACIANALIDEGHPCLVTNFARIVNTIQGLREGKQEYIDSLNDYSLLVVDDLAAERDTEYMNETIMNVVDARYRIGKPIIVTTNLSVEQLQNPSDIMKQRIYSRLLEMCIPIEVSGGDRRKEKLISGNDDIERLLGLK